MNKITISYKLLVFFFSDSASSLDPARGRKKKDKKRGDVLCFILLTRIADMLHK